MTPILFLERTTTYQTPDNTESANASMTSTPSTISASVTRILSLTGFPKELKTKDIQTAFADFENANGGFKIKWIDDTSLYIVFQDPTVGEHLPALYQSCTGH